jgi:glycosyltransferase involved in cell wall biosynthesis
MLKAFLNKCPAVMNRHYLLFLGRIDEKKGVDMVVDAYKKIAMEGGGRAAKNELPMLVIAGPGLDSPYGGKIQKTVMASSCLSSSVAFTGMLTGDAKWGAFYGADAFILPSHQENFGMALVEAMACGKPVLISNKVNIWQEVADAQGGLVAEDTVLGTVVLLSRWMTLQPEQRRLMGERARQCYEERFSVEIAARRLLKELNS